MSIFDFFTNKKQSSSKQSEQKDERKAECPYCNKTLAKIPGAKTKCPHCDNFMFVCTRPKDNTRIIVTENNADKIDEEWSIVNGTHDSFVAEKENYAKEKEILRKRFGGKEPSENDIKWGLLNKELIEHATSGNWGLYRNTKFQMAKQLQKENKFKHALQMYLEICYLDSNGPNNTAGFDDPEFLKDFPPFDPNNGNSFLAPGIIDLVKQIMKKLGLSKDEVNKLFLERNSRIEKSMKLPVSMIECWDKIQKEL